MLLSLVDILRCPAGHEETSLVLSVESWSGQRVAEGILGCPVCHARYRIRGGAVDFAGETGGVRLPHVGPPPDALRLAAQLSLQEPGGIVLLAGHYAAAHEQLADMADVICLLVDAPAAGSGAVNIAVREKLPLVDRAIRGAAIDEVRATPTFLAEVARSVRWGGRLVAPAESLRPSAGRLVAQDEREWVVEIDDSGPTVPLRRAGPR